MRGALIRTALVLLGALHLSWGGWAYLAPRHFFDTFPGFGHRWTGAYPPYNQHLVADLGATFLTLGALLVLAAVVNITVVTRVVLAGVALFSGLHLLFHVRVHGGLTGVDLVASLTTLVLGLLAPVVLLLLIGPDSRSTEDRP